MRKIFPKEWLKHRKFQLIQQGYTPSEANKRIGELIAYEEELDKHTKAEKRSAPISQKNKPIDILADALKSKD